MTINDIFGNTVIPKSYTSFKSLYGRLVGMNVSTQTRLLIDLHVRRKSFKLLEMTNFVSIPSAHSFADKETKNTSTPVLNTFLDENYLERIATSWVERKSGSDNV